MLKGVMLNVFKHLSIAQHMALVAVQQDHEQSNITDIIRELHAGGSDFRLFDGSHLKTYLLMRW